MNSCLVLADAEAPAKEAQGAPQWTGLMMPVLLIAIFYFMFLRPQQRREKERRKMIDELRAGAKVVFAGGIVGTIVEATETYFTVETRDGSKMDVLRSAVQALASDPKAAESVK